jgi:penicillin-binding protein 1A
VSESNSEDSARAARSGRSGSALPTWAKVLLRIVAGLFGLAAAAVVSVVIVAGIALAVSYPNLPEIDSLLDYRPKLPMRVFSSDGVLLGEFGEERRNFVPIGEIPKVMQGRGARGRGREVLQHSGVNYVSVIRAGLANFGEARSAQGASTITMQVARNFYLSSEKTFTRKIYEMLLSLKIESLLTKEQILEVYMNHIALGQRAYGFSSASEIYFGKPLKDITSPRRRCSPGCQGAVGEQPDRQPERATIRQRYIIDRMLENGFITAEQHEAARKQVLRYRSAVGSGGARRVRGRAGAADDLQPVRSRGLHARPQRLADARFRRADPRLPGPAQGHPRLRAAPGLSRPEDYVDLPADLKEMDARIADALQDFPDNDELKAAVVTEASAKKVVAVLQNGQAITITGEGLKPAASALAPSRIRRRRSARRDRPPDQGPQDRVVDHPAAEVEGAFVALDPRTGAVRAMVGGFDYSKSKFNHVTQAWRQPGSSFKPFIYSASLEKGFTPATVINDAPLFFDAGATGSQPWEPKNYDGTFDGPMTMRRGLAKSKNLISIRILKSIGPAFAQQWITRFGFDAEKHPAYLTMALGAGSVTPLQMASAYSVFANGGYRVNPMLISRITDTKGHVINEARVPVLDESMRTLDARNAFVMTSLLQEVTRSGTAAKAQAALKRVDVYGKTGTTNDSIDAWFAGWQKNVVGVVWMGYDQPRKLGDRETGGGLSLPVWIDYMSTVLKGVPVQEPAPPGRRGQRRRRVVLRGVRPRCRREQRRPRGEVADRAERGRAQLDPRPVPQQAALRAARPGLRARSAAPCRRARWRRPRARRRTRRRRASIQRPPDALK